jgi:hypothetical protein
LGYCGKIKIVNYEIMKKILFVSENKIWAEAKSFGFVALKYIKTLVPASPETRNSVFRGTYIKNGIETWIWI